MMPGEDLRPLFRGVVRGSLPSALKALFLDLISKSDLHLALTRLFSRNEITPFACSFPSCSEGREGSLGRPRGSGVLLGWREWPCTSFPYSLMSVSVISCKEGGEGLNLGMIKKNPSKAERTSDPF